MPLPANRGDVATTQFDNNAPSKPTKEKTGSLTIDPTEGCHVTIHRAMIITARGARSTMARQRASRWLQVAFSVLRAIRRRTSAT
jgi:hypothetical protein